MLAHDCALCPVLSILSTSGHVLGIRPKLDMLNPMYRRDDYETSVSDSFHVVSPVLGVLNPMLCLQHRLVFGADLGQMLLDALLDFWPKIDCTWGFKSNWVYNHIAYYNKLFKNILSE
ncbi:hypothetical protein Tco_1007352 [Tanacetum coccineum]